MIKFESFDKFDEIMTILFEDEYTKLHFYQKQFIFLSFNSDEIIINPIRRR